MFEYTENNHYKWGYQGDDWYGTPSRNKTFQVQLGQCTRRPNSFRHECMSAANLIYTKATKPIIVGLSGGSDSQMVCLSFLANNIPFRVVIVKLMRDGDVLNDFDIATAYKFCEQYKVPYIEFELDVDAFYNGPALEYVKKYGCSLAETLIQCATMDFVCNDYCYIMGGGDVIFQPVPADSIPQQVPHLANNPGVTVPLWFQRTPPIMQHMIAMGYEGTSKFFLYTPELIASYLLDKTAQEFMTVQDTIYQIYMSWHRNPALWWKCFHLLYKPLMTQREWPEIIQARKYTGFEALEAGRLDRMNTYRTLVKLAAYDLISPQVIALTMPQLLEYVSPDFTGERTLTALPC